MDTNTCSSCNENLMEGARCCTCEKFFHFHCVGITESGYRKLGDRKSTWRCPECRQIKTLNAPVTPTTPLQQQSQPQTHGRETIEQIEAGSTILAELRSMSGKLAALESLTQEVKALRSEFLELKTSVEGTNTTLQQFNVRLLAVEERLGQVEKAQVYAKTLEARLDKIESQNNDREQWSRMNNIEIKGVAQVKNENLFDILSGIGSRVHYPITKSLVNFVTRVPTRDPDQVKPIIACFQNRYVKEDFIAAARDTAKKNPLTQAQLGLHGNHKIFINDHLTTQNKNLLTKAKKVKAERGFQYIWVKHAKIHVRKDDTSPIITIKTERDLTKII